MAVTESIGRISNGVTAQKNLIAQIRSALEGKAAGGGGGDDYILLKKATFTDRPSLYTFLESNYYKVVSVIAKMGDMKTPAFVQRMAYNTGVDFIISFPTLAFSGGSVLESSQVIGPSILVTATQTRIVANVGFGIQTDGTTSAPVADTITVLPDAYWSAQSVEVTCLYVEDI